MSKPEYNNVTAAIIKHLVKDNTANDTPDTAPRPNTVYYLAEKKAAKTYISKDIHKSAVVDIYSVRAVVEVGYIHRYENGISIIMEYLDTHEERIMTAEEYLSVIKNNTSYDKMLEEAKYHTQLSAVAAQNSIDADDISLSELMELVVKHSMKKQKELVTC